MRRTAARREYYTVSVSRWRKTRAVEAVARVKLCTLARRHCCCHHLHAPNASPPRTTALKTLVQARVCALRAAESAARHKLFTTRWWSLPSPRAQRGAFASGAVDPGGPPAARRAAQEAVPRAAGRRAPPARAAARAKSRPAAPQAARRCYRWRPARPTACSTSVPSYKFLFNFACKVV
jgi:hypothetical protein